MDFQKLKQKQRALRDSFPTDHGLRVHRALSWLNKSEQCGNDKDSQFIFLWVAFNAAYAQELEHMELSESELFGKFTQKLVDLDGQGRIYRLIWDEFSSSIRLLLNNQYIFRPFWQHVSGDKTEAQWKHSFEQAKVRVNKALAAEDTGTLLSVILGRMYVLRNQLVHGGATWQSSANREQIRDAVGFLQYLVPIMVDVMMDNPHAVWGPAHYPLIEE